MVKALGYSEVRVVCEACGVEQTVAGTSDRHGISLSRPRDWTETLTVVPRRNAKLSHDFCPKCSEAAKALA